MISRILYIIGFLFAAGAAWALVLDFTSTGKPSMLLGQFWFELSPTSLQLAETVISRYADPCSLILALGCTPFLWHPLVSTLLGWPATIALIGLAVAFWILGRLFSRSGGGGSGRVHSGRRLKDADLKRKGQD